MNEDDKKAKEPRVIVVMTPEFVAEIDGERRFEADFPSRSVIVRRLLREALNLRANQRKAHRCA